VAVAWLGLAAYRTAEYGSWQFILVIFLGLMYAAGLLRILIAPRKAASLCVPSSPAHSASRPSA
jgi:hypothetical protein